MGGFMTPNPTPSMEEIRSLVQALVAEALNQRDQQTVVAQQVESLLSQLPQKSGSGRSIECVPGRSIMPLMVRWRQDGAATKYDINLGNVSQVLVQNGVPIDIDFTELTQLGTTPWYNMTTCDGADDVTALYAAATPDIGGISNPDWPVNPDSSVKIRFYTNKTLSPTIGSTYGLQWQIAAIVARSIVWQAYDGVKVGAACMGDGKRNNYSGAQDITSSSIAHVALGVHQLVDFASVNMGADSETRLVVRKLDGVEYHTGISNLVGSSSVTITPGPMGFVFEATGTSADTPPLEPATTVTLGPHDTGEEPLDDHQTCDGTTGIKLWVVTGVVYDPTGSHILYGFRRLITITAFGRVFSVGAEVLFTIATPEPI